MGILKIYKPIGKTPLDMIEQLKLDKRYRHVKMSYAGRLDPMAEGLLIILTDETCLEQSMFHNLNKCYNFQLLIGITTDTYDILGIVNWCKPKVIDCEHITKTIHSFKGKTNQSYPPFSSQRVNGKPLWYYARNNLLHTINIPYKIIHINTLCIKNTSVVSRKDILEYVNEKVTLLDTNKNFRQNDILKCWNSILDKKYTIIDIEAAVSCGTYIRTLCHDIGVKLGVPCMAYSIKRTRVGEYEL